MSGGGETKAERRRAERRSGVDRRAAPRGGRDRRHGDRRLATAMGASALVVALAFAASLPEAAAQIYTRRNEKGVLEATNAPEANDFRLSYPGKGTLIHSLAWRLRRMYLGEFDADIQAASATHGVDPVLVRAVIQVESDFDHLAVSSKGARGLMQLMPHTARRLGVTDSFNARQNIFGGVRYLRLLLDMFSGDVELASAAYNAGEHAVLRYGGVPPYRETREYVKKIRTLITGRSTLDAVPKGPAFYAPDPGALVRKAAAPAPAAARPAGGRRLTPARPRMYYRWTDLQGVLHVGQSPPPEGVAYTMIRALD